MNVASSSGLEPQILVVAVSFLGLAAAVVFLLVRLFRTPAGDRQLRRLPRALFLGLMGVGVVLLTSDVVADSVALLVIGVIAALLGALMPRLRRRSQGRGNNA